jgi:hypothetical protein
LYGFIVLQKQKASYHWPATSGTIVHSERVYEPGRETSHYHADVTFSYKVNGASYLSHQISLWSADLSDYGEENKTFVQNHPQGSAVDVYYDPGNPANAVLVPGAHERLSQLLMGAGALFIILGILGIIEQRRKQPRLAAVSNASDAPTRTVQVRKPDMEKGLGALIAFLLIGMLFLIFGMAIILPLFLTGPSVSLEAPHRDDSWQLTWGGACIAGFAVCLVIASRISRSARCPVCRNKLNQTSFITNQCRHCGTHIVFEGENLPVASATTAAAAGAVAQKLVHAAGTTSHRRTRTSPFSKDRLVDIAGLFAFPTLFVWLWAGAEKRADQALAVALTIIFLMQGALYFFVPASLEKSQSKSKEKPEPEKRGPYLVDLSIILSAPVVLLAYCLYLTWQHQALGVKGLIAVVIGIPAGIVVVTYICKLRFKRVPDLPSSVPSILVGVWLLGTFIWVVFVVWLLVKLPELR